MLIGAQETLINIDSVGNSCAASYCCGNCDAFFLDFLIDRKFKRTAFT